MRWPSRRLLVWLEGLDDVVEDDEKNAAAGAQAEELGKRSQAREDNKRRKGEKRQRNTHARAERERERERREREERRGERERERENRPWERSPCRGRRIPPL